jgi:hypothetical protein
VFKVPKEVQPGASVLSEIGHETGPGEPLVPEDQRSNGDMSGVTDSTSKSISKGRKRKRASYAENNGLDSLLEHGDIMLKFKQDKWDWERETTEKSLAIQAMNAESNKRIADAKIKKLEREEKHVLKLVEQRFEEERTFTEQVVKSTVGNAKDDILKSMRGILKEFITKQDE